MPLLAYRLDSRAGRLLLAGVTPPGQRPGWWWHVRFWPFSEIRERQLSYPSDQLDVSVP